MLSLVLFLGVFVAGVIVFGLRQSSFAQSTTTTTAVTAQTIKAIAYNKMMGDISCTLVWDGGEEIEGECTNAQFGKIIVEKDKAMVVWGGDNYYLKGYGEIQPTLGNMDTDYEDYVYFNDYGGEVAKIIYDNGEYKITGSWHNVIIGEIFFIDLSAIVCGDGDLAINEQCDDKNTNNGDGCDDSCEIEDGWECDGGSPTQCFQIPACGDGDLLVVENGDLLVDEECDDKNTNNGDGCSDNCEIEDGWECDGGSPTLCSQKVPACGDGIVGNTYTGFGYFGYGGDSKGEECDDKNTNNGDGCSDNCLTEDGFFCSGQPSVCLVTNLQGNPATPRVNFPTVFVLKDSDKWVVIDEYEFILPGYELLSASWIKYDSENKVFSIDGLPDDSLMGNYLFTVRNISDRKAYNAGIRVADAADLLDSEGEPDDLIKINLINTVLSAGSGEDPVGLGGNSKIEQIALLLSVFNVLENLE